MAGNGVCCCCRDVCLTTSVAACPIGLVFDSSIGLGSGGRWKNVGDSIESVRSVAGLA
jgi:hypothetical protein